MDNKPDQKPAFDPSAGGGGAVDDLTPPSQTFDADKVFATKIPPAEAASAQDVGNSGADLSIIESAAARHNKKTEFVPRPAVQPPGLVVTSTMAGVNNDDIELQDLSKEILLRNTQHVMFRGQLCPSLNGIPLVSKLGQGGMGAVYCGIHPRLQNRVAVKVLPLHMAAEDAGLVQRLIREAQIAAMIQSPHLAAVYDVNEEDRQFFIVMEYVPGITMGQYLKKLAKQGQGIRELDAIDSCIAATIGLDAAHQEGIIHRDLKPENIMAPYKTRQQDSLDFKKSKLMDLGLARSEKGDQSLTGMKVAMGTPGYMSPEQIMNAKSAGKPSDVYGMGATLYALLTGRPPFKEDEDDDMMRLLFATVNDPPVPVLEKRPDVSAGLDKLIGICLEKKPENRFPDADQLVRALRICRKALSPSSDFDDLDIGGSGVRTLSAISRSADAASVQALSMLAVNFQNKSSTTAGRPATSKAGVSTTASTKRSSPGKAGGKGWMLLGITGAAAAAMLAGSVAVYFFAIYKPPAKIVFYSPEERKIIINGQRAFYDQEFRDAVRDGKIDTVRIHYDLAREYTKQHPDISELTQADANAEILLFVMTNLAKQNITLDDLAEMQKKINLFVVDSDEKQIQKNTFTDRIQTTERTVKIALNMAIAQNGSESANNRLAATRAVLILDKDNLAAKDLEKQFVEQHNAEMVLNYIEKAKLQKREGKLDLATNSLEEALKLKPNDSTAVALKAEVEKDLANQSAADAERAKLRAKQLKLVAATRLVNESIAKTMSTLAQNGPAAAEALVPDVNKSIDALKEIEPNAKLDIDADVVKQRIAAQKELDEYRAALADARKLLADQKPDDAEKKLNAAKKPADEGEFEMTDLLGQIDAARKLAQYQTRLAEADSLLKDALAKKDKREFERAANRADKAIEIEPAEKRGTAAGKKAAIVKVEIDTLYAGALEAARAQKGKGEFKDALVKIDEALEINPAGKDALALEKEVVALQKDQWIQNERLRIAGNTAAAKRKEYEEAKEKGRLILADKTGRSLKKFDDAIAAFESFKPPADLKMEAETKDINDRIVEARTARQLLVNIQNALTHADQTAKGGKLDDAKNELAQFNAAVKDDEIADQISMYDTRIQKRDALLGSAERSANAGKLDDARKQLQDAAAEVRDVKFAEQLKTVDGLIAEREAAAKDAKALAASGNLDDAKKKVQDAYAKVKDAKLLALRNEIDAKIAEREITGNLARIEKLRKDEDFGAAKTELEAALKGSSDIRYKDLYEKVAKQLLERDVKLALGDADMYVDKKDFDNATKTLKSADEKYHDPRLSKRIAEIEKMGPAKEKIFADALTTFKAGNYDDALKLVQPRPDLADAQKAFAAIKKQIDDARGKLAAIDKKFDEAKDKQNVSGSAARRNFEEFRNKFKIETSVNGILAKNLAMTETVKEIASELNDNFGILDDKIEGIYKTANLQVPVRTESVSSGGGGGGGASSVTGENPK